MRWQATLPEKGREIIEDCTRKMADQNWQQRCETVESALNQVLAEESTEAGRSKAKRQYSAGIMIAAILDKLDKLDTGDVNDAEQAKLAASSTDFDHQIAACDWLIELSLAAAPLPGTETTLH